MKLFIFHDDIEEIMVAAKDRDDAFVLIEEQYGAEAADELVLSFMDEYPPDMVVTKKGKTAGELAAVGRRIVEHRGAGEISRMAMVKPSREGRLVRVGCPDRM